MVETIKKRPSQGKDPHDGGGIIGKMSVKKYPESGAWPHFSKKPSCDGKEPDTGGL